MSDRNVGGYLYLAFIGVFLSVIGALFVFLLWGGFQKASETRKWEEVEAVVVVSEVDERRYTGHSPAEYSHGIVYEYRWGDDVFRHDRVRLRENPFLKKRAVVEAEVDRWKVGMKVSAFVNPENPEVAVLEHETKAPGYSIWFPGLFFIGGGVVLFRAAKGYFAK